MKVLTLKRFQMMYKETHSHTHTLTHSLTHSLTHTHTPLFGLPVCIIVRRRIDGHAVTGEAEAGAA